ncbi:GroES-like protein [Aspergillus avenaceus]|uniref:GroES-like protein n=1 Tax=Aspergillus avenaceus TaxID=36643 RepID=A0A5N6TVY9_ASPAV|nr:GroES-like protein [Aspergillus avenaceus]
MPSNRRTAIKIISPGTAEVRHDVPLPRLRDDYIIAETRAFALNPTDVNHIDRVGAPGTIVGCDWSGIVKKVGKNVTRFKPGDEVYGACHGGNNVEPDDGAFAGIITSKEHLTFHKPEHLSFEEAASLTVGLATVGQALYYTMHLPLPTMLYETLADATMLVYGGSSATGTIAIQAAKLSGCRVYTTCSSSNFDLVRSRGADYCFDYNDPDCLQELMQHAGPSITHILDCLGTAETATFCSEALSPNGGRYHSIKAPVPEIFKKLRPEENAIATTAIAYSMIGEAYEFVGGLSFPADPEEERFAKEWVLMAEGFLLCRAIQPHPIDQRQGGIQGVLEGLNGLRGQGPRGQKIVYSR